jgi:hypothetical protein
LHNPVTDLREFHRNYANDSLKYSVLHNLKMILFFRSIKAAASFKAVRKFAITPKTFFHLPSREKAVRTGGFLPHHTISCKNPFRDPERILSSPQDAGIRSASGTDTTVSTDREKVRHHPKDFLPSPQS